MKMSAKILHSLTDENRDLHKQIGCMSGIFQLFDRHHFLSGRRINVQNHKRLHPGENCNHAVEPSTVQKATEKIRKKVVKEKQRNSTESSKTTVSSSSSSCSSSLSCLEHKKAAQQEPSSSSQTISNDKDARDPSVKQPHVLMHIRRESFDLQGLVKDSTHREARGISVKPAAKDGVGHTLKYIDSPRPSIKSTKPRVSGGNESFQVPAKLRVATWSSNEEKDGCARFLPKDARRFSYDGRESRDASKSTIKLKELPRLSLDSKERSIRRGCNPETKGNYSIKDMQREDRNGNKLLDLQHEPGSAKRPSNVVAKLMGLDLSDSVSTTDSPFRLVNTDQSDRSDPFSRSSRATNENKQDTFSGILLANTKKDSSPQRRGIDPVMKPTSNSKFPIEAAPWRQPHRSKGSQRSDFKQQEEPIKAPNSSSSVYGEMEKRLADLEFKKSGKDLRALKQILEAMQKTKGMTDTGKDHASNFASQISNKSISLDSTVSASQRYLQSNISVPATAKGSQSPKSYKSPTVIVKPAKLIDKTHSSASMVNSMNDTLGLRKLRTSDPGDNRKGLVDKKTAKDLTPRNNHVRDLFNRQLHSTDDNSNTRTLKSAQKPKASQTMSEEKVTSPSRSPGITSPKMQQRRLGLEKQSPPSTPSSNSSMTRRQHTRQSLEATTPGRKLGHKTPNLHQSNVQLRETSTKTRDMSHHDDSTSQQSGSTISLASHTDTEATSIHQSDTITGTHFNKHNQKIKHPAVGLIDDRSMAETRKASSEQPSPVSVLDSTFYRDDSPSPVKKISSAFKDDEAQILEIAEYDPMNQALLSNNTMPSLGAEIDHKRLESLIQNHRCMSRTHEDPITGPLCDSTNPDHMYISDILLASGILGYLESAWTTSELNTSDHLINPNLFLALEDIRTNTMPSDLQPKPDEKIQRKQVFEVVNEFLVHKLVVGDSLKQWFPPNKLADGKPRSQQLLKELCSEVDQLQRTNLNGSLDDEDESLRNILLEDFTDKAKNWTECDSEIPSVVLDVERLIFKDLINEIVSDDSVGLHGWSGGHCRQLFSEKGLRKY